MQGEKKSMTTANRFQDPNFIPNHVNIDLMEEKPSLLQRVRPGF
ncbi:MAG: hypothetical protein ACLFRK_02750 [Candidatus Nanohaloarchaea archaeon]